MSALPDDKPIHNFGALKSVVGRSWTIENSLIHGLWGSKIGKGLVGYTPVKKSKNRHWNRSRCWLSFSRSCHWLFYELHIKRPHAFFITQGEHMSEEISMCIFVPSLFDWKSNSIRGRLARQNRSGREEGSTCRTKSQIHSILSAWKNLLGRRKAKCKNIIGKVKKKYDYVKLNS